MKTNDQGNSVINSSSLQESQQNEAYGVSIKFLPEILFVHSKLYLAGCQPLPPRWNGLLPRPAENALPGSS